MNMDDQIGFVIIINENAAIGVTIESGQFVLFNFDAQKKNNTHTALPVSGEPLVTGYR